MRFSLGKVLEKLAHFDQSAAASLSVERLIQTRDEVSASMKGTTLNLEEIRLEAFRRTLQEIEKYDESLALHLNSTYFKYRFAATELYSDTLSTLTTLKRRFIVGLLSNGNNYPHQFGLGHLFSFTILAQEVGLEKPDPRIFLLAASRAGLTPSEIIHVGDSLNEDVAGARNAGMMPIWINRTSRSSRELKVDYEIENLSELLGLMCLHSEQVPRANP